MYDLRERTKKLIEKYEKEENKKKLQRLYIINKILENDKAFLSIPVEDAINILKDLEIENYKEIYIELMSFQIPQINNQRKSVDK